MQNPATNIVDDRLREALLGFPQITLAILFGSVASGKANAQSDLDLAVIAAKPLQVAEKIQIIEVLAIATGRPIDLVDIYAAPEPLLGQVLKHGRRILGADTTYAQLLYRHLIEQADFVPLQNRILSERRTPETMDQTFDILAQQKVLPFTTTKPSTGKSCTALSACTLATFLNLPEPLQNGSVPKAPKRC